MKYQLLASLLGVEAVNLKSGLFGGKPFASFNEEHLNKIEGALKKQDTTALTDTISKLENDVEDKETSLENMENAVNKALETNGLSAANTFPESIELLGNKCKEYGEKKQIHTPLTHNGKENNLEENRLQDGYFDPNAKHNQID